MLMQVLFFELFDLLLCESEKVMMLLFIEVKLEDLMAILIETNDVNTTILADLGR